MQVAVCVLLCCGLALPLVLAQSPTMDKHPPVNVDITNASVWRCSNPGRSVLKELKSRGRELQLEVLTTREDWIEIITSINMTDASHLSDCTTIASFPEIIVRELEENWATLKHHISPQAPDWISKLSSTRHSLKRSVNTRDCREGACEENVLGDKWFTEFHNLSQIYSWFTELANKHSSMVTLKTSIGKTHFGRDIVAVHITDKSTPGHKPKIYLQCLLHAREWISGSVCIYIARYLATPDPSNLMLADLLKKLEFIIVPVANPDGYFLTWLEYPKYRLWRKNVSPVSGTECAGVDLNRNFDVHWSEEDSPDDPCSELYCGSSPASEAEVQAIANYIHSNGPVYGAIDFHSYYQEVLYPPAWTKEDPKNVKALDYIAQWVAASASQIGEEYTYNKMNEIYLASGTFPDWMLARVSNHDANCIIPLTVELRPKHRQTDVYKGFLLPPSEILPTCQEMIPAVVKFSQLVLEECHKQS